MQTKDNFLKSRFRDPSSRESALLRVLRLLRRHPLWLRLITASYFIAIVSLHDVAQQPAFWAERTFASSPAGWNNLVSAFIFPIFALFCFWIIRAIARHNRPAIAGTHFALTALFFGIAFCTIVAKNIETIHFLQYAILAILIYAITGSYSQSIAWTTLAGLLDEANQFFYLYANRGGYMDFNDVIMNTIGAAFGLVILYSIGPHEVDSAEQQFATRRRFVLSPAGVAMEILGLGTVALYALGRLRILRDPENSNWCVVLRRGKLPTAFWSHVNWGKTYHEVQPGEWIVVTILLVALYSQLDTLTSIDAS